MNIILRAEQTIAFLASPLQDNPWVLHPNRSVTQHFFILLSSAIVSFSVRLNQPH